MALNILLTFVLLRVLQHTVESYLAAINRKYYLNPDRQREAMDLLKISEADMTKALAYSRDRFTFGRISGVMTLFATLVFIILGGLGWTDALSKSIAADLWGEPSQIVQGLVFFSILGLLSSVLSLPFEYYHTFVIEERHGFNKQSPKMFFVDRLKGLLLTIALGGPILAAILWIMGQMGDRWWIWAWIALSSFSLLTAWLYPTFLAPLFNKFRPLPEGPLKDKILALANNIQFNAAGLLVMDASKRSSHGNAYFTGVLNKKKIVLFDTLLESLSDNEVVAVLAHELGHFKLHHVRWALIRGTLMTGAFLYFLSLCLPLTDFYHAFHLPEATNYGALVVFSMWFGIIGFVFQPISTWLSRRNEFAADDFALRHTKDKQELGNALLKLRERSHSMPITHPLFATFYYSHPPLLERLKAMGFSR
jgi:STE24 endopeptidase